MLAFLFWKITFSLRQFLLTGNINISETFGQNEYILVLGVYNK